MKISIRSLFVGACIATMGLVANPAAAEAAKYQIYTINYLVDIFNDGIDYTHSYTVVFNPCNHTFAGTGQYPAVGTGSVVYYEKVANGKIDGKDHLRQHLLH